MESNNLVSGEKSEKKQIKSFAKYENIKADYFLQKVFDNLEKKRTLEIVKNNKNIKKRININIMVNLLILKKKMKNIIIYILIIIKKK